MQNKDETFDRVKYDAQACIDLFQAHSADTGSILAAAVAASGPELLLDPAALGQAMEEAGAPAAEIFRVQLMTQVPGFRELVAQDSRTAQLDLDRFIFNASEQTGFTRDTILRLTGGIVFALGGNMAPEAAGARPPAALPQTVALLAASVYESPLKEFQQRMKQAAGGAGVALDFDRLEPLVNMGIPRAKYCLGYCLLNGLQVEANEARGLELLEEAASLGDSQAAAALGDHYYRSGQTGGWSKAYRYYTGPGAIALDPPRQAAVNDILNQKIFNQKFLLHCGILLAVFAAALFFPPGAVSVPRILAGVLALAGQAGTLVWAVCHFRAKPYDRLYHVPVIMAGIWFAYMACRIFLESR